MANGIKVIEISPKSFVNNWTIWHCLFLAAHVNGEIRLAQRSPTQYGVYPIFPLLRPSPYKGLNFQKQIMNIHCECHIKHS